MTDSNPDAGSHPTEPASDQDGASSIHSPFASQREPNFPLRIAIVAITAAVIVFLLQQFVSERDHQNANLFSFGVIGIALLTILLQLFRLARNHGYPLLVPVMTIAMAAVFGSLYRFEGFSGEMVPDFKLRFGRANQPGRVPIDEASGNAIAKLEPSERTIAAADSTGFLGNLRNGYIPKRKFEMPSNTSEAEVLWRQGIGEGWSGFAVTQDRAITLEQRDATESLTCYRLGDGALLWAVSHQARHEHPLGGIGPRSTPTIMGDRVYALGATGMLLCIEIASGEQVWNADLLELAGWNQAESETAIPWGRSASPLLVDGLCIVPLGGPSDPAISASDLAKSGRGLVAFDAANGEIRWSAGEDQISYASPMLMTLAGQRQVVIVNESSISGHRIDSGKVLWSFSWPGQTNTSANCSSVVLADDDRFLVGKGYGGGSALVEVTADANGKLNAEAVWQSGRVLKTKFANTVVVNDTAYALSNGSLEAVAIAEGEQRWRQPRRERSGQGQILVAEDLIVVQDEAGDLLFVSLDEEQYQQELRMPALNSKTWNVPTIAGRHLIVRNDREAICFLLPSRD
ncbi:Pyrrolo-quinoline quinone [Rhodopirellula maiorica SM1]|uniref:Pyrrolo-quinoline quinone n=1 Tax=Rhodopirellula maiorica SM1 TaxID=1265738 RepID=M5RLI0_9BACT|nr:PQQ-binding-like beta-propeller repeat protein [Rhodopirellula maiorica]EMI20061.1 Pyrrolo-quinoline quinone [Rhodopirellula maiorica SM1]